MSVTEALVTTEDVSKPNSGESYCEVSFTEGYSKINGSVYGGGDLGQIGIGVINTSNNTATITKEGKTFFMKKLHYLIFLHWIFLLK